jgi:hypothetical protein
MDTHCDACGEQNIEGRHADTECGARQWAIHQARLLGQIAYHLKQIAAALPPAQSGQTGAAKLSASE